MSKSSAWIQNPTIDLIFIFSSFWVCALMGLAYYFFGFKDFSWTYLFFWISGAHLIVPLVVFWSNPKLRAAAKQKRAKYIGLPLFYILMPLAFGAGAYFLDPHSQVRIINFLALYYMLWNAWHFTSHHRGVLTLYRMKVRPFKSEEKKLDSWYSFLLFSILLQALYLNYFRSLAYPFFRLIDFSPSRIHLGPYRYGLFFAIAVLFGYFIYRELKSEKPSKQRMLYAAMMAFQVALSTYSFIFFYVYLVSLNHWLTEIAFSMKIAHHKGEAHANKLSALKFLSIFIGCLCLIRFIFDLLPSGPDVLGLLTGLTRSPLPITLYQMDWILLALYFSLHFLHMLYDRYIFSFRLPEASDVKDAFIS